MVLDPLALSGLAEQLAAIGTLAWLDAVAALGALASHGLRLGALEVPDARPGLYEVDLLSFEAVASEDAGSDAFEVDSGTAVLIDVAALAQVARELTWERYDWLLQAAIEDESRLAAINESVGGPRFAIMSGDVSSPFTGDGAFRIRPESLRLLS